MFKKLVKWGFIGFGIYFFYQMIPLFIYMGLYGGVGAGIDRTIQSPTKYSNITMGPYHLRIPKAYLYKKDQLTGGAFDYVYMYALLPDISPRTHQNQDEVKISFFPRGDKVINFRLEYFNHKVKSGEELLHSVRSDNTLNPNLPGEIAEFGLTTYSPKPQEIVHEVFSYKYEDGELFIVECEKYKRRDRPPFNSSCEQHNAYIADGLYLSYEFSRSHLKSWREIDLALKHFIHSLILEKKHD